MLQTIFIQRARKLIPTSQENRYTEIEEGFVNNSLTHPIGPMSDGELAKAIAEFVKKPKSQASLDALNDTFNPKS